MVKESHVSSGMAALAKAACILFLLCAATATISPAQTYTPLYSFCSLPDCADGESPNYGVVQGNDGNFYGTAYYGGSTNDSCPYGCGTVFKITPQGQFTLLHTFCSQTGCADGALPGPLVQGRDGNFYGVTSEGGGSSNCQTGCGTLFRITPQGSFTTLLTFNAADGAFPNGLIQAMDGNFYGTTCSGGSSTQCSDQYAPGCGTAFKITPTGTLNTLHSFNFSDGFCPNSALLQTADGNFYGTTGSGGTANQTCSLGCGTVFEMTSNGTVNTLHSFEGPDGYAPIAALVQGTDSNFYGTASYGGTGTNCTDGCGTVFKITPQGTLTSTSFNGADGGNPTAQLIQATDGNFYGTTIDGGNNYGGVIFETTSSGTLTPLFNFCLQYPCPDGGTPFGGLIQASDGTFYGTTSYGGAGIGVGVFFSFSGPAPTAVQFVPVTPCRVVDTRNPNGPFGGPALQSGTFRSFVVPQGGCNIPATATSYSLNVTVVPHQALGYLTIWSASRPQPYVSTMNSPDGRIKANAAIVPAGASGAVSVYVTDTSDVVLDIDGYFAPAGSQTLQFYPLTPCRLVDTRGTDGPLGGPRLPARQERDFPLLMNTTCIPSGLNPQAYSLNFTVVPNPSGQQLGYLTVWPRGEPQPVVSTLNNPTATVVANAAIVPAGKNGEVAVYAYNTTDLLIDINGYFAAPGTGGYSFYPAAPCRAYDSRSNGGKPFSGKRTLNIVGSVCTPPSSASGYVFNATVVPSGSLGYLTLWPDGEAQPVVSTLNAQDGFITSNMAIVPNINGSTDAYAGFGSTQLILDISGYFAP